MIGIICALKIEVDGLKALMENPEITKKAGLEFTSGKIFDKDVVLLESGVGKVTVWRLTSREVKFGLPTKRELVCLPTKKFATSLLSAVRDWAHTCLPDVSLPAISL